jgi:hypothetical protein
LRLASKIIIKKASSGGKGMSQITLSMDISLYTLTLSAH